MLTTRMIGNGSTTQACAACKYQRRKCSQECPLAPYFPPDQPKQFLNVHRLFGVSNILRILRLVDPSKKSDAMKSIIYEADAWEKDPVHGCYGIITMLQNQVDSLKRELELVRNQLFILEQQHASSYYSQQHSLLPAGVSHPFSNPWICQYMPSQISLEGTGLFRGAAGYDVKPAFDTRFLDYETKHEYQDSKEVYESSAESSLRDPQSSEHVPEHELKNAAALFSLTSQNEF